MSDDPTERLEEYAARVEVLEVMVGALIAGITNASIMSDNQFTTVLLSIEKNLRKKNGHAGALESYRFFREMAEHGIARRDAGLASNEDDDVPEEPHP